MSSLRSIAASRSPPSIATCGPPLQNSTSLSCPPDPMATALSDIKSLASGIRANDRATLARAITLIESKRADHQGKAHQLVQELLPQTGKAIRVGITGAPGVGKSTTIDTLGSHLTGQGHRVAVLAVD